MLTNAFGEIYVHWAQQDSNLQPRDYESPALPLSYRPALLQLAILPSAIGLWNDHKPAAAKEIF